MASCSYFRLTGGMAAVMLEEAPTVELWIIILDFVYSQRLSFAISKRNFMPTSMIEDVLELII